MKLFLVLHKSFLINKTNSYIQQELTENMYSFSVQHLTYLVTMSLFWVSHNCFCCCNIFFCDSFWLFFGEIFMPNVTSMWNFFFCWHNILFVQHVKNVSMKNIVKRNRYVVVKKIWKDGAVFHILTRFSSFRGIKRKYYLKS